MGLVAQNWVAEGAARRQSWWNWWNRFSLHISNRLLHQPAICPLSSPSKPSGDQRAGYCFPSGWLKACKIVVTTTFIYVQDHPPQISPKCLMKNSEIIILVQVWTILYKHFRWNYSQRCKEASVATRLVGQWVPCKDNSPLLQTGIWGVNIE